MRLLAILLALWLNRHPQRLDRWRRTAPLLRLAERWHKACAGLPGRDGPLGLILLLAPPVGLAVLVQWWATRALGGLAELVLGAAALLFTFGTGRVEDHLQRFLAAWRRGDRVAAGHAAAELDPALAGSEANELPERVLRALLWESLDRWAGPVFWLLALGPAGALAFRLVCLARPFTETRRRDCPGLARSAAGLAWLAGWIPARLQALSFGLAGSFSGAVEGWQSVAVVLTRDSNRELLAGAGLGALGLPPLRSRRDVTAEGVEEARTLVRRALLLWLAAAALATLAGWVA